MSANEEIRERYDVNDDQKTDPDDPGRVYVPQSIGYKVSVRTHRDVIPSRSCRTFVEPVDLFVGPSGPETNVQIVQRFRGLRSGGIDGIEQDTRGRPGIVYLMPPPGRYQEGVPGIQDASMRVIIRHVRRRG